MWSFLVDPLKLEGEWTEPDNLALAKEIENCCTTFPKNGGKWRNLPFSKPGDEAQNDYWYQPQMMGRVNRVPSPMIKPTPLNGGIYFPNLTALGDNDNGKEFSTQMGIQDDGRRICRW